MKLVQRNRIGQFARIWFDTSDLTGEHFCHEHPLGSKTFTTYWCGHTCAEDLCRRYLFVWKLTHPRHVIMNWFGRFPDGTRR